MEWHFHQTPWMTYLLFIKDNILFHRSLMDLRRAFPPILLVTDHSAWSRNSFPIKLATA